MNICDKYISIVAYTYINRYVFQTYSSHKIYIEQFLVQQTRNNSSSKYFCSSESESSPISF